MLWHLAIVTIFQYQPFLFNSRLNVLKLTMQFKGENKGCLKSDLFSLF